MVNEEGSSRIVEEPLDIASLRNQGGTDNAVLCVHVIHKHRFEAPIWL
jgi:hypothetical protein